MTLVQPSPFLRAALWLDVAASGGVALLQLALTDALAGWTGLGATLLAESALVMLGWGAWLALLARQRVSTRGRVQVVIGGNVAWALAAAGCAVTLQPAAAGWAWLGLHVMPVLGFAALQAIGLARSAHAATAA